jgi:ABC-type branched-subunit amino acid transport system substrate-binding protein
MRLALFISLVTGCSLTRPDVEPCTQATECAARFGFGSVCNADGLCERALVPPRCESAYPDDLLTATEAYRDSTVFGVLVDRQDPDGVLREQAARLAIVELNRAGGLDRRPLGMVFCTIQGDNTFDSLTRTDAAIEAGRYFAQTLDLPAIVAMTDSVEVAAVFNATDDVLLMSSAATSDALAALESPGPTDAAPGRLWRTAPSVAGEVEAMVGELASSGRPVIVLHEEGGSSEELAIAFRDAFTATGTVELRPFPRGNVFPELSFLADSVREPPEIVLIARPSDGLEFLANVEALAADPTTVAGSAVYFFTSSLATQAIAARVPPDVTKRLRGTRPTTDAAVSAARASFDAAFTDEYGAPLGADAAFVRESYDAAWLLAYGAAWSGYREFMAVTPVGIGRGLRRVSEGPVTLLEESSWPTGQPAFARGESIDAAGASGTLDFDPASEEPVTRYEYWFVNEGEILPR